MAADYTEIYLKNVYEIDRPSSVTFSFSLDTLAANALFLTPFAIITAWNPDNIELSAEVNRKNDAQLYKELYSYRTLEARGCYEDHCEAGYLVFDMDLKEALRLGQKYKQYAIFYNDSKKLMYVECESAKVIVSRKIEQVL